MSLQGCGIGVIGAGIGGLAAALALARRGARVRVFEQAERLGEIGAGIQLGPNAVTVLEALGRRDAVAAQASAPEAIELRDYRGGRLVGRGRGARRRWRDTAGPTGICTAPTCWRR